MEFSKYAAIKDRFCICYFGSSDEYLVQLRLLKPLIEAEFPGIVIHIGCKDNKVGLLGNCEDILRIAEIKLKKFEFGQLFELQTDLKKHPIEAFLDDCGISDRRIVRKPAEQTVICAIVPNADYPTMPLSEHQIEHIKKVVKKEGFDPIVTQDASNAGLVVGVESVALFDAIDRGIPTRLVPTGIGTRLYKQMVAFGEVWDI